MSDNKLIVRDHSGNVFDIDNPLPCPCCGGTPELQFKGNNNTKSRSVTIKCGSCRLQRTDGAIRHNSEWVANVCVGHWNKRI